VKHVYKYLSALLLVSYIVLCHFRQPQISDAIIILVLGSLLGLRMYFDHNELPDIRAEVAEAFANRDEVLKTLENKVNSVNYQNQVKRDVSDIRF